MADHINKRRADFRLSARRLADTAHKWLGFTCGAVLVIAGLTGALLAFYIELDGALNPQLRTATPDARASSYEAVYRRLDALPVVAGGYWKIELPPQGGPITSRYYEPQPDGSTRTRLVTVDPVTLRVMRDAHWRETFFTWIYDLHMNLLLGPPGKILMGILAVAMLVMLLSGLANWALPHGDWRSKLRFKRRASRPRRTYDLHKIGGLASVPLMLLCVGTGAMICLPKQVQPILNAFSPLKPQPKAVSGPADGRPRISVDAALRAGPETFAGSTVVWVRVPQGLGDAYDLQIRQSGDPMTRFPKTHVWVDQYSGAVLAIHDPHRDAAGDTVLNWLVPLHDGKAFGIIGRVLVLLLGLFPALLFVTGLMRWKQKRAARHRRRDKHTKAVSHCV